MKRVFIIYCLWYLACLLYLIFDLQILLEASLGFDKVNSKQDLAYSIILSRVFITVCWSSYGYLGSVVMARFAIFEHSDDYLWGCFILFSSRSIIELFAIWGFDNNVSLLILLGCSVFGFFIFCDKLIRIKNRVVNHYSRN